MVANFLAMQIVGLPLNFVAAKSFERLLYKTYANRHTEYTEMRFSLHTPQLFNASRCRSMLLSFFLGKILNFVALKTHTKLLVDKAIILIRLG